MNLAMISIAPDVLNQLLALRLTDTESVDDVLRRALPQMEQREEPTAIRLKREPKNHGESGLTYHLLGKSYSAPDAMAAMVNILSELAQYDSNLFTCLASRVRGRTRNHIAQSRAQVYPNRPDLARYVREVSPGWFIGSNIANREKIRILHAACEVVGISFGQDLQIELSRI